MSDPEQDDEFESYLKRRVPIKKGTTPVDRLEPPAELDRIVIGQARQAIQGPTPMPVYRAPKWALPTALAASILISFAVLLGLSVRAAKHADAPQAQARLAAASPGAPSASAPSSSATSQSVLVPPRIATPPWPPIPRAEQPAPDKARARIARTEIAAKRSRPEEGSSPPPPAKAQPDAARHDPATPDGRPQ
jgi:hypothetical protein